MQGWPSAAAWLSGHPLTSCGCASHHPACRPRLPLGPLSILRLRSLDPFATGSAPAVRSGLEVLASPVRLPAAPPCSHGPSRCTSHPVLPLAGPRGVQAQSGLWPRMGQLEDYRAGPVEASPGWPCLCPCPLSAQLPSGEKLVFFSLVRSWQGFQFFLLRTRAKYFTTKRSENRKDNQLLENSTKKTTQPKRNDESE